MLELLDAYGIRELARTGRVALARGGKGITDKPLASCEAGMRRLMRGPRSMWGELAPPTAPQERLCHSPVIA